MEKERTCKVCGANIVGRSDKVYCSYNCRIYANNIKNRKYRENYAACKYKTALEKILRKLILTNSVTSLKIILITAYICKIFSKFARNNKHSN